MVSVGEYINGIWYIADGFLSGINEGMLLYSSYVELDKTLKVVAFLEMPSIKTDLFTD